MKTAFRISMAGVVALATYFIASLLLFFVIGAHLQLRWIHSAVPILCALVVGGYAWLRSGSVQMGLIGSVAVGAIVAGAAGFSVGFFGPIIFAPGANQGPLVGIFVTGPLGFLLGAVAGGFSWFLRRKRTSKSMASAPPAA